MDWIPVTSDIPRDGELVLVSYLYGRLLCVNAARYVLGKFFVGDERVWPDAWLPMPKPYYFAKHEEGIKERKNRVERLIKYGVIKC